MLDEYITPDMAVYEGELIRKYEAFAASISCSSGAVTCQSAAISCSSTAVGGSTCSANVAGCGSASYCTTKSS